MTNTTDINQTILQNADRHMRQKNELRHSVLSHEFITRPPSWILKSGITMIAFLVVVLLGLAYFIKYPDKITAKGSLSAYQPPLAHYTKKAGVITTLYVKDEQMVSKGSPIAYMDNTADMDDIHKLKNFILKYEGVKSIKDYIYLGIPDKINVGELTPTYNSFVLEIEKFQATLKEADVFKKINTLKSELATNEKLLKVIETDQVFSEEEMALIEKDFKRNVELNQAGFISDLDKEKAKAQLIQQQKSYNQTNQSLLQNQIKDKQLNYEISKLTEERALKVKEHLFTIKSIINKLNADLDNWEDLYIIKAKINGRVSMRSDIVTDRYINQDDAIATIIPEVEQKDRFVKVIVPSEGIGKIIIGNRAVLKFDAYPYKEYGMVNTTVKKMALLPDKDDKGQTLYEVQLSLPDTIETSFYKIIPYKPDATLVTDIITEEKSILGRIFESFLDLVRNG